MVACADAPSGGRPRPSRNIFAHRRPVASSCATGRLERPTTTGLLPLAATVLCLGAVPALGESIRISHSKQKLPLTAREKDGMCAPVAETAQARTNSLGGASVLLCLAHSLSRFILKPLGVLAMAVCLLLGTLGTHAVNGVASVLAANAEDDVEFELFDENLTGEVEECAADDGLDRSELTAFFAAVHLTPTGLRGSLTSGHSAGEGLRIEAASYSVSQARAPPRWLASFGLNL